MGSFSIALITTFLLFASAMASRPNMGQQYYSATPSNILVSTCKASRDPASCESVINQSGHVPPGTTTTALQVISSLLNLTLQNLETAESQLKNILTNSGANLNLTKAANSSLQSVVYARYRVMMTVQSDFTRREKLKDGRAWMGAALSFNLGVLASLKNVNTTEVAAFMDFSNTTLVPTTRDALSMLANYDIYGDDTDSWGPILTERDGFWEPVNSQWSGFVGGVPKGLPYNATVCKDDGGDQCTYKTVQEAVDAAPRFNAAGKFVIWIKAGVYNETVRVVLDQQNVVLLGDGIGKTVITGSLMNAGEPGMSTMQSATVAVVGDGFMARDITFENTAVGNPAVAFRSDADRTVMESCEFRGNQDTLYARALRQYYKSCRIQGNVDFIFGNAAAFFQDCEILIAPRPSTPEAGEDNVITAHGRLEAVQSTGFVFQNCSINGTEKYMEVYRKHKKVHHTYLGRPWREYSRTVFIGCNYGDMISEKGWFPWVGEFALKTLYYGEYGNTGTNTSGRVEWSSTVPEDRVSSYSLSNFIQGDQWIH
ncbi:unnamed protein product [Cuscuta epithymum]|uniref:pectinesterase n=1 Tax=Cuscuta epithymum TaxID=186058 RepID=A0AAV0D7V2_9ASTE|nr:unnamed protein product [Cuscuta epithymum]